MRIADCPSFQTDNSSFLCQSEYDENWKNNIYRNDKTNQNESICTNVSFSLPMHRHTHAGAYSHISPRRSCTNHIKRIPTEQKKWNVLESICDVYKFGYIYTKRYYWQMDYIGKHWTIWSTINTNIAGSMCECTSIYSVSVWLNQTLRIHRTLFCCSCWIHNYAETSCASQFVVFFSSLVWAFLAHRCEQIHFHENFS